MPTIDRFLSDLFDYAEGDATPLPLDEEREAILAAQAGDEDALLGLLRTYSRALRSTAARYRQALDVDDLRAEILAAFLVALGDYDPARDERLAAILPRTLTREVSAAATRASAFAIPERTLQRFYGILRRGEGDVSRAAAIAPQYEMTTENFLSILAVVRETESLSTGDNDQTTASHGSKGAVINRARSLWGEGSRFEADAEDAILCEAAFRAVDDVEGDVCRLAYGFADYDPVPDAEIGHRLGLSRPTTQRKRASALGKMREALAVA